MEMDELWTPEELADYFKTSTKRLANDRYLGQGPRFVKVGKFVRYRKSDIIAYLASNTYTRTDTKEEPDDDALG